MGRKDFLYGSISTHSLTRRLTHLLLQSEQLHLYFNSQPHKEADGLYRHKQLESHISTHSLTRRLTYHHILNNCQIIFQLTASQGG